ncbi:hypothetical protein [Actinomadura craniellae]|nr:hypothetical protein [Actinomadura craniellae]
METARGLGIPSPEQPSLTDRDQTVGDHQVAFHALTRTENPWATPLRGEV